MAGPAVDTGDGLRNIDPLCAVIALADVIPRKHWTFGLFWFWLGFCSREIYMKEKESLSHSHSHLTSQLHLISMKNLNIVSLVLTAAVFLSTATLARPVDSRACKQTNLHVPISSNSLALNHCPKQRKGNSRVDTHRFYDRSD